MVGPGSPKASEQQPKTQAGVEANFFSGKPQVLLSRLPIDWMRPTHTIQGELLTYRQLIVGTDPTSTKSLHSNT